LVAITLLITFELSRSNAQSPLFNSQFRRYPLRRGKFRKRKIILPEKVCQDLFSKKIALTAVPKAGDALTGQRFGQDCPHLFDQCPLVFAPTVSTQLYSSHNSLIFVMLTLHPADGSGVTPPDNKRQPN
jgi:hypothetical protein